MLRGVLIGAGYFSDFHLDAWSRIEGAEIVAVCDRDEARARAAADKYAIGQVVTKASAAMDLPNIDFVDIATPPPSHFDLVQMSLGRSLPTLCQKPLAPDDQQAAAILELAAASNVPFMVHENFRFQPWYREIRRLIDDGILGRKLHSVSMRSRMGDGWGSDAYLARQPYFREMPRLLIHETGVHFVDTFRYLAGEIDSVQATLRRWNDGIRGEDAGVVVFQFSSGAVGLWDANRYNESLSENPRYTFGELCVEGDGGSLWLADDGTITVKPLGQPATRHEYAPSREGFAGDCVRATQQHFIDVLRGEAATCETSATEYGKTLDIVEKIYRSAAGQPDAAAASVRPTRKIIDLSLTIDATLPAATVEPLKSIDVEGWRATTLNFYSHSGTHLDAPCHFLPDGQTLEEIDLQAVCGVARVINLAPVEPREWLSVDRFLQAAGGELAPGQRLLLRTDWHHRYPASQYRDDLPRISTDLARYFVERRVRLVGVEPPSVADVNNLKEVTEVHHILFKGGVVIVEGLVNLDQIDAPTCEFVALPAKIAGGDGSPVRAIAILGDDEPAPEAAFGFRPSR